MAFKEKFELFNSLFAKQRTLLRPQTIYLSRCWVEQMNLEYYKFNCYMEFSLNKEHELSQINKFVT